MFSFSIYKFFLLVAAGCNAGASAEPTVDLGVAGEFAILAKSGISTVPDSSITGDIGVSPIAATAMTGFSLTLDSSALFSTSVQVTKNAYAASYGGVTAARLTTAVSNMETAYTDAAGRGPAVGDKLNLGKGTGALGGETLTPGVYTFDRDVSITSDVTFSGSGVFIIQISKNLEQSASTQVALTNGATATNIFWQVAETVTVDAGAHMEGIILAKTKVVFKTGSSLYGRILAQTACTLDEATVTEPPTVAEPLRTRRGLRSM